MKAIFEVSTFRNGKLEDVNQKGMLPSDCKYSVIVPHEGDLDFTKNHFGEFLDFLDPKVLDRLSKLEADNGATLSGERIAQVLSQELKTNVVMMRFLVDRVLLDGNRWKLVNPNEPKNCSLRPILPPELEPEAIRALQPYFEHWNRAVRMILAGSLSAHPHTYTPTGTDAVLKGTDSILAYINSHISPERPVRATLSPVTFRGMQDPKSPMGIYIATSYKHLGGEAVRVGYPYGGDLPDCMASDVLKNQTGIVSEANQLALAKNPEVMLTSPWDVEINPDAVERICVNPCVEAVLEWAKKEAGNSKRLVSIPGLS